MAITILGDRIQIGNFTLSESAGVISGDKRFAAEKLPGTLKFNGTLSVTSLYSTDSQATIGTFSGGAILGNSWAGIDKFPFSTISSARSVSTLFQSRAYSSASSSKTSGYVFGGTVGPGVPNYSTTAPPAPLTVVNTIDRFAFQNNLSAKNIGSLGTARTLMSGQSSSSHGYSTGGYTNINSYSFSISKYPFSTDIFTAETASNLTNAGIGRTGFSSSVNGYFMTITGTSESVRLYMLSVIPDSYTGNPTYPPIATRYKNGKFPFSNDAVNEIIPTFTGNLPTVMTGVSAPDAGYFVNYCSVDQTPTQFGQTSRISKFPFANETTINFAGYLYGAHPSTIINRFVRTDSTVTYSGAGYPGVVGYSFAPVCEHNYIACSSGETMAVLGGGSLGEHYTAYGFPTSAPGQLISYFNPYFGDATPSIYYKMRRMDTFPFASDAFCTYVGDLATGRVGMVGHSDK